MSVSNSKDLFINVKNPPFWDRTKHYWEQSIDAIQFYENELYKIHNGITIDGVFIHPWLYFHINYFKTVIPDTDGNDQIILPSLRDNEWYMAENYAEAQRRRKGLFMYGSRRWAKSSNEASILYWNALTRPNTTEEIICGSTDDLRVIGRLLQVGSTYIHPALALPTIRKDWTKHIQFGFKEEKTENPITYSEIFVKNADAGKDKASEKGAGGAPSCVILDETGKYAFLELYNSLLPSISTPYGLKAVVILSGTSGNEKLSQDAFKVLSNPEGYQILPMNWDLLENKIDPEHITWTRNTFGMFTPPQMAYEPGVIKHKSNLAKYLKVDSPELEKILIDVTDWAEANKIYRDKRDKLAKDKASLMKEIMYHPLDSEECFTSGGVNPFPVIEARLHKLKLIEEGNIGKNVDLFRKEDGTLGYELSDKERAKFPFEGGIHNAPVILFQDPPNIIPYRGKFVSGLDSYKTAQSTTTSVGTLYVLERRSTIKTPIELIVASYASRPTAPTSFYRICELLIEGWNAECLAENVDLAGFLQYLDAKGKAEKLLADGLDFSKTISPNSEPKNKLGYYPTPRNVEYIFKLVLSYCWEEFIIGQDEEGGDIKKYGVEFIPDIDLLDEIINYKEKGNFDRIVAFGSALAWAKYLDSIGVRTEPLERDVSKNKNSAIKASLFNKGYIPFKKK